MKQIIVPAWEYYDKELKQFIYGKETKLTLEHSLLSLSKWEAIWNKPFLSSKISPIEMLDYIKCMTITPNVSDYTYYFLTPENIEEISNYIDAPMTARRIRMLEESRDKNSKKKLKHNSDTPCESVYYSMICLGIPFEPCEKWHFNRLLSLIEYCSDRNEEADPNRKKKKKSKGQLMAEYAKINEQNAKILFKKEG